MKLKEQSYVKTGFLGITGTLVLRRVHGNIVIGGGGGGWPLVSGKLVGQEGLELWQVG